MFQDFYKRYKSTELQQLDVGVAGSNYPDKDDEILRLLAVASDALNNSLPSKVTKRGSRKKDQAEVVVKVDWKFLCHLVQANSSFLSIVVGKLKSKGTFDECFLSQLCGITSKLLTTTLLDQLRPHLAVEAHCKLIQSMITSSFYIVNVLATLSQRARSTTEDVVNSCFRIYRHDSSLQLSCVVDAVVDNAVMRAALSNLRDLLLLIQSSQNEKVERVDGRPGWMDAAVVYKIVLLLAQVEQVCADADYVKEVHPVDSFLHDTAMGIWKLLLSLESRREASMVDDLILTLIRFECGDCSLSSLLDRLDPPDSSRCDHHHDQLSMMRLEVLHLLPFFSVARTLKAVAQSRPQEEGGDRDLHELATRRLPFEQLLLRLSASKAHTAAANGGQQIFFRRLSLVSSFIIKWLKVGRFEDKAKLLLNAFTQEFVQSLVEVVIAIPVHIHKSSSQHGSTISSSQHMSHIIRHVGSLLSVYFSASSDKTKGTSMILIISLQAAVVDEIMRTLSLREADNSGTMLHAMLDMMSSLDSMCLLMTMKTHLLEYIQSPQLMQSLLCFVMTYIPHAQHMVALLETECKGERSKVLRNTMEQHNSKLLLLAARSSVKHLFPTASCTDLPSADGLLSAFSASTDSMHMRRFRSLFCFHLMTSLNALLLNCGSDRSRRDRIRDHISMVIRKLYRVGDAVEHQLDDPAQYDWLLMELQASALVDLYCPDDEQAASTLTMVTEHVHTILTNLVSVSADNDHTGGITDTKDSAAQGPCQQRLILLFKAAVVSSMLSHHHARHHHQPHFDDTENTNTIPLRCTSQLSMAVTAFTRLTRGCCLSASDHLTVILDVRQLFDLLAIHGRTADQMNLFSNLMLCRQEGETTTCSSKALFSDLLESCVSVLRSKLLIQFACNGSLSTQPMNNLLHDHRSSSLQGHITVDRYVLRCFFLLHRRSSHSHSGCGSQDASSSSSSSAHRGVEELSLDKPDFIKLTEEALKLCHTDAALNEGLAAACVFPAWMRFLCAKVLFIVYEDVAESYRWVRAAIRHSVLHERSHHHHLDKQCNALDEHHASIRIESSMMIRLEANLLSAELHEHVGDIDSTLMHLADGAAIASTMGSQSLTNIVLLHSLRIWYLSSSPRLISACEAMMIVSSDPHCCHCLSDDVSSCVRSAVRRLVRRFHLFRCDDVSTAPQDCDEGDDDDSALHYRYMCVYWDINVDADGCAFSPSYHHVITKKTREELSYCLTAEMHCSDLNSRELLDCLYKSKSFEGTKMVRRRVCSRRIEALGDPLYHMDPLYRSEEQECLLTFVFGASSCQVSLEFYLDTDRAADREGESTATTTTTIPLCRRSMKKLSSTIHSCLMGDRDQSHHLEQLATRMRVALRHLNTIVADPSDTQQHGRGQGQNNNNNYQDNNNSLLCYMCVDELSQHLLVGRLDSDAGICFNVRIPLMDRCMDQLLEEWDRILELNKLMLKQNSPGSTVGGNKLSNEQKLRWWSERQQCDDSISQCLQRFEDILGPWKLLLLNVKVSARVRAKALQCIHEYLSKLSIAVSDSRSTALLSRAAPWMELIVEAVDSGLSMDHLTEALRFVVNANIDLLSSVAGEKPDVDILTDALLNIILSITSRNDDAKVHNKSISITRQSIVSDRVASYGDLSALKLVDLRKILKDLEVDCTGRKADLVKRIQESLAGQRIQESLAGQRIQESLAGQEGPPATGREGDTTYGVDQETTSQSDSSLSDTKGGGHVILLLDEQLQRLPMECMPCLRHKSCSRVNSLAVLLKVMDNQMMRMKGNGGDGGCDDNQGTVTAARDSLVASSSSLSSSSSSSCSSWREIELRKGWYALDVEANLPTTRQTVGPLLRSCGELYDWRGYEAERPQGDLVREHHQTSDLFVYCGHGSGEVMCESYRFRKFSSCPAALLWGCSSGRLRSRGIYDAAGPALNYLLGGAPFVVGTLWDVTDRDIDSLSMACMETSLLLRHGDSDSDGRPSSSKDNKTLSVITLSLMRSRDVCKMRHAVGSSPVVYGLPCHAIVHL